MSCWIFKPVRQASYRETEANAEQNTRCHLSLSSSASWAATRLIAASGLAPEQTTPDALCRRLASDDLIKNHEGFRQHQTKRENVWATTHRTLQKIISKTEGISNQVCIAL